MNRREYKRIMREGRDLLTAFLESTDKYNDAANNLARQSDMMDSAQPEDVAEAVLWIRRKIVMNTCVSVAQRAAQEPRYDRFMKEIVCNSPATARIPTFLPSIGIDAYNGDGEFVDLCRKMLESIQREF